MVFRRPSGRLLAWAAVTLFSLLPAAVAQTADPDAVRRGEYLLHVGGCIGCHTDSKNNGALLAGGRPLKTPFGTFYGPNITPDPQHGIGRWTEADFVRAMRHGIRPDGANYFPVFPYTSFTKITDSDLKDLWAYLRTVPQAAVANKSHEVGFPFNLRFLQTGWKWLNFATGPFQADSTQPAPLNRGAYLVQALAHCGECHTPRNSIGGLDRGRMLAGTADGPEGERVPNITPDSDTGIGKWSPGDLTDLLKSGMTPDGDFVGGSMGEVVRNTTGKLTDADVSAIVAYLKSLVPIQNRIARKSP